MTVIGLFGIIGTVDQAEAKHNIHIPEITHTTNILNCTAVIVNLNTDKGLFDLTPYITYGGGPRNQGYISYSEGIHSDNFSVIFTLDLHEKFHTEQWIREPAPMRIDLYYTYITNHNTNSTRDDTIRYHVNEIVIDYSTEHNQLCFFYKNEAPPETNIPVEPPKTRLQLANEKIETLEAQLNDLQTRYNNLQSQPRSNSTELTDLQTRYNTLETQYNTLQTQHSTTLSTLSDLQSQYNTLQTKADKLKDKKDLKIERKDLWKERWNTCFENKENIKTQLETTTQELNQYKLDIVNEQNQYNQMLNDHETQITTLQGNITEYKLTIEKLKQEKADLIKKVETLETQLQEN